MRETKELKVKYFVEDLEELCCVPGSDWVDLRASEDLTLKAGEFRLIPLGIAVALPEGYEAHVALPLKITGCSRPTPWAW